MLEEMKKWRNSVLYLPSIGKNRRHLICNMYYLFNPNWHEAGRIYPPYNFWIGFCQLNFYQKFPNIFGGEN